MNTENPRFVFIFGNQFLSTCNPWGGLSESDDFVSITDVEVPQLDHPQKTVVYRIGLLLPLYR